MKPKDYTFELMSIVIILVMMLFAVLYIHVDVRAIRKAIESQQKAPLEKP